MELRCHNHGLHLEEEEDGSYDGSLGASWNSKEEEDEDEEEEEEEGQGQGQGQGKMMMGFTSSSHVGCGRSDSARAYNNELLQLRYLHFNFLHSPVHCVERI